MTRKDLESKRWEGHTLEDLLLDDGFYAYAKRNFPVKSAEWEQMLQNHPDMAALLEQAYLLINEVKITLVQPSDTVMEQDLEKLLRAIKRRKQRKRLAAWVGMVACGTMLFLGILIGLDFGKPERKLDQSVVHLFDQMQVESDSIQVIVKNNDRILVDNNAMIKQSVDGSLLVNAGEKIGEQTVCETGRVDQIQVIVPYGKRLSVEFSDGSKAWLNSGTKLIYPAFFEMNKREIYLDGEIYLEVSKDTDRPFYIRTRDLQVKVLGTTFNLSAYKTDIFTEVVLVNGSVEVQKGNDKNVLVPNTRLCYEQGVCEISKVDVSNYTCWKDGYIKINDETLDDIFVKLSRHYNVQIQSDSTLSNKRYKGKLDMNISFEEMFRNIALTVPMEFVKTEKKVLVRKK